MSDGQMYNEVEQDKIASINTDVMILKNSFTANRKTIRGTLTKTFVP